MCHLALREGICISVNLNLFKAEDSVVMEESTTHRVGGVTVVRD